MISHAHNSSIIQAFLARFITTSLKKHSHHGLQCEWLGTDPFSDDEIKLEVESGRNCDNSTKLKSLFSYLAPFNSNLVIAVKDVFRFSYLILDSNVDQFGWLIGCLAWIPDIHCHTWIQSGIPRTGVLWVLDFIRCMARENLLFAANSAKQSSPLNG